MCIRSEPSVYVCVRCYRITLLFLGLIKGYAQLALHVRKFHLCYETNALGTRIWGLDKEQMYGGEAVTACSKFLQFSGH